MKDYRKRIKERKQGFPEPKTPPKLTKEEEEKKKVEDKANALKEAIEREEEANRKPEKPI